MEKVVIESVDGTRRELALVQRTSDRVFVCAPESYEAVVEGRDRSKYAIGFPIAALKARELGG